MRDDLFHIISIYINSIFYIRENGLTQIKGFTFVFLFVYLKNNITILFFYIAELISFLI